jgi:malate dehydrogenase
MSVIAIIGAGALGGALAHKLAGRSRVREIRLIDSNEAVARGKALDIAQSGPIEAFSTAVHAYGSIHAAAGAEVIVLADAAGGTEHSGEAGLALVRQLKASGAGAPLLFAGTTQRELMTRCATELHMSSSLLLGSAPMALAASLRALCAVVLDASAVEVSLDVVGIPPRDLVVAWQEASVSSQPLASVMAAHDIAALSARVPSLWPPGPYALGAAGARVAEALCVGSRRQYSCFVDLGRGRVAAMPVEIERGRIKRVIEPALTRQERTALENAVYKSVSWS